MLNNNNELFTFKMKFCFYLYKSSIILNMMNTIQQKRHFQIIVQCLFKKVEIFIVV